MRPFRVGITALLLQVLWIAAGCCPGSNILYRWSSIETTSIDNSGRNTIDSAVGTVPAAAYGIRLHLTSTTDTTRAMLHDRSLTAYATSCEDNHYIALDTVDDLRVFVLSGDSARDVTDRFRATTSNRGYALTVESLDDLRSTTELMDAMNTSRLFRAYLLLTQGAEELRGPDRRFVVAMTMRSDTVLADTTDLVTLN